MKLKGKDVVVAGLDKSGIGAVKYAISKGANVTVVDLRNRLEVQKALSLLKDYEFKTEFGRYNQKTFSSADLVLYSMKTKHDDRALSQARSERIPVKTEYEFTSELIENPVLCVTGTNGKSTTAILVSEILRHSGKKAYMNGHIGKSIYEYLLDEKNYDMLILELDADYFKYAAGFNFEAMALLNITDEKLIERSDSWQTFADHIKLYTDFVTAASKDKLLVYSRDCDNTFTVVSSTKAKAVPFSLSFDDTDVSNYKNGSVYMKEKELVLKTTKNEFKYNVENMRLRGDFNKENMLAAVFISKHFGAQDSAIEYVIDNFAGVEHRLEFVQKKNSVYFYNDARVSTVKGLVRSLSSFTKPLILIAGGKDRGENYEDLIPCVQKHVKTLILIGESKERMNRTIGDCTETFVVGTFEEAVVLAYQKSKCNDIILYSPGCCPMDVSSRIEERGKLYKEIINTF